MSGTGGLEPDSRLGPYQIAGALGAMIERELAKLKDAPARAVS